MGADLVSCRLKTKTSSRLDSGTTSIGKLVISYGTSSLLRHSLPCGDAASAGGDDERAAKQSHETAGLRLPVNFRPGHEVPPDQPILSFYTRTAPFRVPHRVSCAHEPCQPPADFRPPQHTLQFIQKAAFQPPFQSSFIMMLGDQVVRLAGDKCIDRIQYHNSPKIVSIFGNS